MTRGGLPHSDIFGSKLVCSSPKLFAACHVLHRLLAPRHSPYTLSSLTIRNSKLTLTNCLHVSWSATVPCNTACVCGRKKLPFAEYSVVKDQSCRASSRQSVYVGHRSERRLRSAKTIGADVGAGETREPHHSTETFQRARRCWSALATGSSTSHWPANRSSRTSSERRLVENTGLEPVTSWLQTRRSPS